MALAMATALAALATAVVVARACPPAPPDDPTRRCAKYDAMMEQQQRDARLAALPPPVVYRRTPTATLPRRLTDQAAARLVFGATWRATGAKRGTPRTRLIQATRVPTRIDKAMRNVLVQDLEHVGGAYRVVIDGRHYQLTECPTGPRRRACLVPMLEPVVGL